MRFYRNINFKLQLISKWLKCAWHGCFQIYTHASWMIFAGYKEKFEPDYFEKAVLALASDLLKRGVVSVHQSYDLVNDAHMFRANLRDTFDSRKVH